LQNPVLLVIKIGVQTTRERGRFNNLHAYAQNLTVQWYARSVGLAKAKKSRRITEIHAPPPNPKCEIFVKLFPHSTEVFLHIPNHFQAKSLKEFWRDFTLDLVF